MPDNLSVELQINEGNAEVVVGRAKQKLEDFVQYAEKAQPQIKFSIPNQNYIDLDKLEKRAEETRKKFQQITSARLDVGNINGLTREIVTASERSRQLQTDIANIRKELLNPNRKSSVAFLTEELKAAEKEADQLNRKLSTVNTTSAASASGKASGLTRGRRGSNTEFTRAALEVVDDFVPAGFNRPFNAVSKEMLAISTLSTATLATFGAIAAVGYGIVKITQNIREEAERRLKVEEGIAIAANKQILSQQEALRNLKKLREEAAEDRIFNRELPTAELDELKNRKATLEKLLTLTPATINGKANDTFERTRQQLLAIDAQIEQIPLNLQKRASDAFNQRWESWKKSQENAIEFVKKQFQLALQNPNASFSDIKKTLSQVQNSKDLNFDTRQSLIFEAESKIKQISANLHKIKDEFRDTLISSTAKDNPYVKLMSDFESATERAQKKFGSFGDSVVKKISDIEKANLTKAIGLQKFENNLQALKFNQEARKLALTPDDQFADYQRALDKVEKKADSAAKIFNLNRQISEADFYANKYNPNNPKTFAEYSRRGFGNDMSDAGEAVRNAIADISGFKSLGIDGTGIYGKEAIAEKILNVIPSRDELLKRLGRSATRTDAQFLLGEQLQALEIKRDAERRKLNDFLENQQIAEYGKKFAYEQIDLVNSSKLTASEKAQRRLAVTDALGNDLDSTLKRGRIQDFFISQQSKLDQEKEAIKIASETRNAVKQIADQLAKQGIKVDIGEKAVVNLQVDVKDGKSSVNVLGATPNQADVQRTYLDEYSNQ